MKEITKIIIAELLDIDSPKYFKEFLIKDFTNLEAHLEHLRIMYGIELEITIKEPEKNEGRWLGKGLVEEVRSFADLVNKK